MPKFFNGWYIFMRGLGYALLGIFIYYALCFFFGTADVHEFVGVAYNAL